MIARTSIAIAKAICLRGQPIGVEVGVAHGEHMRTILSFWPGIRMIGVDPYEVAPEHYDAALYLFDSTRAILLKEPSVVAAKRFNWQTIDFVYIDGDHTFDGVWSDIHAWWPTIVKGGLLCGHDYENTTCPDVRGAVDKWAAENGQGVHFEGSDWWIFKT